MELLDLKKQALFNYLQENDYQEVTLEDITEGYTESNFEVFKKEYNVFTEEEREEKVTEYIKDSLWAFNTDFILSHVNFGRNYTDKAVKAFQKMQEELCEDANDLVLAMIKNLGNFVNDAVKADGYGHFLSGYDGNENESSIINENDEIEWLYIYRQN